MVKKFLHILHGRFSGTHCLISLLKTNEDDFCFISSVPIFQIFIPTYEMVSCPFHTVFADGWWNWRTPLNNEEREKSWYYSRCNILYNLIYIIIASASCIVTELSLWSSSSISLEWSQYINLSFLSCKLLIFLFIELLWFIHIRGQ